MAERYPLSALIAPAIVVSAVLAGVVPLVLFAMSRGGATVLDSYVLRVTMFTLLQATLSTALSIVLAVFVALALARRVFPGKRLVLSVFAVPLALPAIVAVLGIVQVYGSAGWFGGWFTLYGLTGILIAHVFFNLPLTTRLLLEALETSAPESHRLAAQLSFSSTQYFRHVDWPVLKPAVLRAAALIFLLCAASFVIVLTLGGGPHASTLEVAIYQSLRLDFDVSRAVTLSLIQTVIGVLLLLVLRGSVAEFKPHHILRVSTRRYDGHNTVWVDAMWITVSLIFVALPLIAVIAAGLSGFAFSTLLLKALSTSLLIAIPSTVISVILSYALAKQRNRLNSLMALLAWIIPPAVIATGWFLAFGRFSSSTFLAMILIISLNALMALPFGVSAMSPALARISQDHNRLCAQLGLVGWRRLRVVEIPALRRPLLQAALMAFVLSLGDLTAVTLLGSQELVTLPSLISQQMGSYRGVEAGGTALLLTVMCFGLTLLAQKIGDARD